MKWKIIDILNIGFLLYITIINYKYNIWEIVILGLFLNIITVTIKNEVEVKACRECYYKASLFTLLNLTFVMARIVERMSLEKKLINEVMISVLYVMIFSFSVVMSCAIVYIIIVKKKH